MAASMHTSVRLSSEIFYFQNESSHSDWKPASCPGFLELLGEILQLGSAFVRWCFRALGACPVAIRPNFSPRLRAVTPRNNSVISAGLTDIFRFPHGHLLDIVICLVTSGRKTASKHRTPLGGGGAGMRKSRCRVRACLSCVASRMERTGVALRHSFQTFDRRAAGAAAMSRAGAGGPHERASLASSSGVEPCTK
jgi:hypothetical protein